MAGRTDRDLLSVDHPEDAVKAGGLPLIGEFPNVPDVVHDDLRLVRCVPTNAAGLGQLGAGSHVYLCADKVRVGMLGALEGIPVFGPVVVEVERDGLLLGPVLVFDDVGQGLPEALEHFGRRDLELPPQGHGQREVEDVLDTLQVRPIVRESVVVLDAAIDAAVQKRS